MQNSNTQRLRSYHSTLEEPIACAIWEAVRATSAAPTSFEKITFECGTTFRDGALRDNNPIFQLVDEAEYVFPGQEISTNVSLGTGVSSPIVVGDSLLSSCESMRPNHRFYQLDCTGKFPVKFFAARKELEFIAEYLYCPTNDPTCSTIITLTGLGGSGKTQLMLQYASKQRDAYGVVLWFDARSMETLRESFEYAACQLCGIALPSFHQSSISASKEMSLHQPSIDINFYKIWKELRIRGQRWLLLLDEVDDILMINGYYDF